MAIPELRSEEGRDGVGVIWEALDDLLSRAEPEGALRHGLGPLAARRLRRLGLTVPERLEREEHAAGLVAALTGPVLERVRRVCDGPLVLLKGPEVALRYPARGRAFSDLDLLTPRAEAAQLELLGAGFRADELGVVATYHLQPLIWERLPLQIELHHHLKWPEGLPRPPLAEILEASVPSRLGIDGVLTPCAAHHALILAAHSWEHRPLRLVRDLVDVALLAAEADESEIAAIAVSWQLGQVWRTTRDAAACLFEGGRRTAPLLTWARHLPEVREPTVLESHLERWMSPFWGRPLRRALVNIPSVLAAEVRPLPGESWPDKLARSASAARHATLPLSRHDAELKPPLDRDPRRN